MTTLTIDILDEKAMSLIKDLELLKIIRVRKDKNVNPKDSGNLIAKYKGAMSAQSKYDIDRQLDELRHECE